MIVKLLKPLATRGNATLLLVVLALIPLPLAIGHILPDARLSLLLPVTLLGVLFTWLLGGTSVRPGWAAVAFLVYGPLALLGWIAQAGSPLLKALRQAALLLSQLSLKLIEGGSVSIAPFVSAQNELSTRLLSLSQRILLWIASLGRGVPIEDPAARAFVWCLALWMLAVWGTWRIRRHSQILAGLIPSTIALGIILDTTTRHPDNLWLHLAALFLLCGLTNYERLEHRWREQRLDYSDSTREETLIATFAVALVLVTAASMASHFSVKEMIDHIREQQQSREGTTVQSSSAGSSQTTISGGSSFENSALQKSHEILAGQHLSDTVFMLIKTGDLPKSSSARNLQVPRYYWRTMTYERYIGSGWTNPPETDVEIPAGQVLIQATPANYRVVHQEVTFPNGADDSLYWTGALVSVDTSIQTAWRSPPSSDPAIARSDPLLGADQVGALLMEPTQGYTAESLLPQVSADELRAAPASYPGWIRQNYLSLPDSVPERVRALARDLTVGEETPYDRALAIENYLRQIPYSLDVPAPPRGRDATDYFLFDLKEGYCDYYATAMTVLARAAGLPARFVIGYASGTYDPANARYVVTEADSHAWTEIYFSGIGWIEFEPTAGQPALLRPGSQNELPATSLAPTEPTLTPLNLPERFLVWAWRSYAPLLIFILSLAWLASESLRFRLRNPTKAIQQVYGRLRQLTRPISGTAPPSETMHQYAHRLSASLTALGSRSRLASWLLWPAVAQINTLTQLHSRSMFAPHPTGQADARQAFQAWSSLRWRLLLVTATILLIHRFPHE